MPRRKAKIPRITFGPANSINLTNENWRKIEKAYGRSISEHVRKQILGVTTRFLQMASAEKTGLMADAVERATQLRDHAQSLFAAIDERSIGDAIREFVDETIADIYGTSNYEQALPTRGYVIQFRGELTRFLTSCELTLREFEALGQFEYWPDGRAWEEWVGALARIAASHGLPHRVSKDPNSRQSPFVALICSLQEHLPSEHARGRQSKGALASVVNDALRHPKPPIAPKTAVANREAKEERGERKKTRNSSREGL